MIKNIATLQMLTAMQELLEGEINTQITASINQLSSDITEQVNNKLTGDLNPSSVNTGTLNFTNLASNAEKILINKIYPVGSIYISVNAASPSTLFGGTWQKIEGKFLLGSGGGVHFRCSRRRGHSSPYRPRNAVS